MLQSTTLYGAEILQHYSTNNSLEIWKWTSGGNGLSPRKYRDPKRQTRRHNEDRGEH